MSDNATFYESFAPHYASHYGGAIDARAAVDQWIDRLEQLSLVPPCQNRRTNPPTLIDVGCGPGWHLPEWAAGHFAPVGLDVSPTMLRIAAQFRATDRSSVPFTPQLICADIRRTGTLSTQRDRFAVAVAHFNFLNLFSAEEIEDVFASVCLLLRSGGVFTTDLRLRGGDLASDPDQSGVAPTVMRTVPWQLPSGRVSETYWLHPLRRLIEVGRKHGLSNIACLPWHPNGPESMASPSTGETEKAWLAFQKS